MRKIYAASSWRNIMYPLIVEDMRNWGHEVFDFRNPPTGSRGFHWSEIDPDWRDWDAEKFKQMQKHDHALRGFRTDYDGMVDADTCVMILPCGKSAHMEAGWLGGSGRSVFVYTEEGKDFEPELMYGLVDGIFTNKKDLRAALDE